MTERSIKNIIIFNQLRCELGFFRVHQRINLNAEVPLICSASSCTL
jgi:hypothetical protein